MVFRLRQLANIARKGIIPGVRNLSDSKSVDVMIHEDGVAIMTLQRPPVNALNLEMFEQINKLLDEVYTNKCKGMVITSTLPKIFCGGLDISELYNPDLKRAEAFWTAVQEYWLNLFGASFVTTAAINGHAPGAGCVTALSCEYRVMARGDYTIGLNEVALGITAPKFVMDMFSNVIPKRQAELALTTGKLFTADEALQVGLIDDIGIDKQDAISKCKEFIKKFDNLHSMQTKQIFREASMRKLREYRREDLDVFLNMVQNPEVQAALERYVDRLKLKQS